MIGRGAVGSGGLRRVAVCRVVAVVPAAQQGWSVLVQGSAHHVESESERASVLAAGVEPWAGGVRELFVRILPTRITGRRISNSRTSR
ncbi:pyridoxamine 5'-phosphate oxidase family protein [Actinomadura sp. HBU206391]|uniref:pyridoxamine 5'-phosphate oxidase family protein n=1 Tax=Actinomadura sp. HBU206391 TaxID=2731692 RepID=UPI00164F4711|nr:pyridoxamine 5'-phosphate oxidase family protein [Actinomadura sp. HBU206391]MBC6461968.1 pyridoxamine 5'-phosphate oxidase family protein [Actinomadura sp. HBU206391]